MLVYLDLVILLNFFVDLLLMIGANRLCGYPTGAGRAAAAAAIGGVYGGICIIPGMQFLGNTLWRMVCLGTMAVIACGCNRSVLRRGAVFVLLSMSLGGIALGLNGRSFLSLIMGAVGICVLCRIGFGRGLGGQLLVRVSLNKEGRTVNLLALRDTGNTLYDPISGGPVTVVGADIGWELLGFTPEQLRDPVEAVRGGKLKGARLIPYRAVGQSGGLLLAVKLDRVTVDGVSVNPVVAFAPDVIGRGKSYQALTGGYV